MFALVATMLSTSIAAQGSGQSAKACSTFPVEANGWQRSYRAGCQDRHGTFLGGSELLHLVAHKGMLFAANGYWEDKRNPIYGGSPASAVWAQVLRLDRPDGVWESDLELGRRHLRAELLKSITFTTDEYGHALSSPANLLVAATYDSTVAGGISFSFETTRAERGARAASWPVKPARKASKVPCAR